MSLYPDSIARIAFAPRFAGRIGSVNAVGTDASFSCGAFVRFELSIDPGSKSVESVGFRTNGCGYMIAAADRLAESIADAKLTDLHALADFVPETAYPKDRADCLNVVFGAMRNAFSRFRQTQLDEFAGEKALICTCFGISEETIESCGAASVDEVGKLTNAGTGCGSCRMLIADILETAQPEL